MFDGAAWVDTVDSAIKAGSGTGTGLPPGGSGSGSGASSVFIGTSPPPNPSPGTQWWNGSILQMSGRRDMAPDWPQRRRRPGTNHHHPVLDDRYGEPGSARLPAWASCRCTIFRHRSDAGLDGFSTAGLPTKAGIYQFQFRGISTAGGGIALLKNDPGTFTNAPLSSDIIIGVQTVSTNGWLSASGLALMNGSYRLCALLGLQLRRHVPRHGRQPVLHRGAAAVASAVVADRDDGAVRHPQDRAHRLAALATVTNVDTSLPIKSICVTLRALAFSLTSPRT